MMHKDSSHGFTLLAYVGDGTVLLAFDVDIKKIPVNRLAGFSIWCRTPHAGPYPKDEYFLTNAINFPKIDATSAKGNGGVGSDEAPFQTFHWIHMPGAGPGKYRYTVSVRLFDPHNPALLDWGPKATVDVDLSYHHFEQLELGFTRGEISSQAYADRFHNQSICPEPRTIDYDTTSFQPAYQWLGAHARQCLFKFLEEAEKGFFTHLDVFAYDLDEPDIIRILCKMGKKARVYLDDYKTGNIKEGFGHGSGSLEDLAATRLAQAKVQVMRGHFSRFSHDKVLILKHHDTPTKVLTGSANFSVRGLYVQSNSILVFDNPKIAAVYEKVFQQVWQDTENNRQSGDPSSAVASAFRKSELSKNWIVLENHTHDDLPRVSVSFSPHHKPKNKADSPYTLTTIANAINNAKISVFFALMEAGQGAAIDALNQVMLNPNILSMGVTQSHKGFNLHRDDLNPSAGFTSFHFLEKHVPAQFLREVRGGEGQILHHKFVVCDFNGPNPVVFCGSSNLAKGGEEENGDNLLAIYDPDIATCYAVEAIRLFDHYHFRSVQESDPSSGSIVLDQTAKWITPYFDANHFKCHMREILAGKRLNGGKIINLNGEREKAISAPIFPKK